VDLRAVGVIRVIRVVFSGSWNSDWPKRAFLRQSNPWYIDSSPAAKEEKDEAGGLEFNKHGVEKKNVSLPPAKRWWRQRVCWYFVREDREKKERESAFLFGLFSINLQV
jgi:hypothetical protein